MKGIGSHGSYKNNYKDFVIASADMPDVELILMFSTWLSATVFHALSGIICITAILGYGFGQETGTEVGRMLLAGFILYILPVLSGWAVMWLETIKIRLMGD